MYCKTTILLKSCRIVIVICYHESRLQFDRLTCLVVLCYCYCNRDLLMRRTGAARERPSMAQTPPHTTPNAPIPLRGSASAYEPGIAHRVRRINKPSEDAERHRRCRWLPQRRQKQSDKHAQVGQGVCRCGTDGTHKGVLQSVQPSAACGSSNSPGVVFKNDDRSKARRSLQRSCAT
ncbi:hypothetical protein BGY98DRAFT_398335 [Russula aff. rugulosa BPL654]|nr:hypothetical protein BGY98DRAFT_398335 [Russula aff. rugulosa BPL654]